MDTKTPKLDPQTLYNELDKRLRSAPIEVQQRILAHLKAETGHTVLNAFHNNGATEEAKVAMYKLLIRALLTKNYDGLKAPAPEPAPKPTPAPVEPAASEVIVETPRAVVGETIAKAFGMDRLPKEIVTIIPDRQPEPPRQEFGDIQSKAAALVECLRGIVEPADKAGIEGYINVRMDAIERQMKERMEAMRLELVGHIDRRYREDKHALIEAIKESV